MSASQLPLLFEKEFLSIYGEKWEPLKVSEQESRQKELNMIKYFCLGLLISWWSQEEGWLLERHRVDSNITPNTSLLVTRMFLYSI